MLFVIHCVDKDGHLELRKETREAHLAYLKQYQDQIVTAGPTTTEDGQPTGSLLIMEFPDRAAAERFAANDPYAKAGLFQRSEIKPWKKVFP